MTLVLTFVTLALAFLLMPDAFTDIGRGAIENPVFGGGAVAILALIWVWIDRR